MTSTTPSPTTDSTTSTTTTTDDIAEAVITCYEHGDSLRKIANKMKRHPMHVARILEKEGIPRRQGSAQRRLTPEQEQAIIERYQAGETAPDLARQLGVAVSTVSRCLTRNGVQPRGDRFKPTFDQQLFTKLELPGVRYWLGVLASPRCQMSGLDEPGEVRFTLRVPADWESRLVQFRDLLQAPNDKERLVRCWATLDGFTLTVVSLALVKQLHHLGIVAVPGDRRCRDEQLATSPEFWAGLVDAAGVVEADKLVVRASNRLCLQLHQFVRSGVPDVVAKVGDGYVSYNGEHVQAIVELLHQDEPAIVDGR